MKTVADKLHGLLAGFRVLRIEAGSTAGRQSLLFLYEDYWGRPKQVELLARVPGNSFEDTFDERAEVTEPRPVSRQVVPVPTETVPERMQLRSSTEQRDPVTGEWTTTPEPTYTDLKDRLTLAESLLREVLVHRVVRMDDAELTRRIGAFLGDGT